MDSVLKSWGFRTSRDPFQENSSQALEGNKGQKSTPLREVVCSGTSLEKESPRVCPLERDDSSGHLAGSIVRAGGRFLGRKTPKSIATQSFCHGRFSDCGVTKAGSLNKGFATPNGRDHLRRGVIHHSVRAHLCLRLGAGIEICRQLSGERKLLDPMVWSVVHLHAEPVGLSRRIQQTKGWTPIGSNRAPEEPLDFSTF